MTRWGRRISSRVLLLVALGMVGPLCAMAWVNWHTQRRFERAVLAERALLASFVAARFEALLSAELEGLQGIASQCGGGVLSAQRGLLREAWVRRHAVFDSVFLVDKTGAVVAQEPASAIEVDGPRMLAHAGQLAFTELDGRHVWAIAPVRTWDGALAGVVGGAIDPARLAALLRSVAQPDEGRSIDVADGNGRVIASTDSSRVFGEEGSGAGELVASAPLRLAHWTVSVRQPQALASIPSLPVALPVALFGVALLFAWGAARSVTRPLGSLTRAAGRIADGELSTPIARGPDDEIGRLAEALEGMRIALKEARDKLEKRVQERTAQVRRLFGKLITAQEHERRRVARELHDETAQTLAALAMHARGDPQAEKLAMTALDSVHRLIVDLRPSVLDDLGLKSAINWYAERHLRGLSVRCEFGELPRLPAEVEIAVFRIVQEALTNVQRHAKASSVLVQAGAHDGKLFVEVEDDGEGFDPGAFAKPDGEGHGWGLLGMRERVELLGGKLHVDSERGKGTHIAVDVPLH